MNTKVNNPISLSSLAKKPDAPAKKIYKTYEDFDYDKLCTYAGLDCITTSTVLAKLFPKLVEQPIHLVPTSAKEHTPQSLKSILQVNEEVGRITMEYILDLEMNGFWYDVKRNREISALMMAEIEVLEERIFRKVPRGTNLDSGDEVRDYLYNQLGLEAPGLTKGGDASTDGEALLVLAGLDPIAPGNYITPDPEKQFLADMAKRRDLVSVHNTFIKTYVEDFVKRGQRIYPSYNLHGTSSFRITGDNPNLTQLPRPKHGYNLRECYGVPEGYFFLAFDFSSAEVKILGALCRDPNMLRAIRDGLDFHSFSASAMINVPYEDFVAAIKNKTHPKYKEYKELRQTAKILTFSLLYGSSVNGIAMQLNLSKEEAERLVEMYFTAYPGVRDFVDRCHLEAKLNKRVVTPFGQRRQEYGAYECFKWTAAYNASLRNSQNVKVQSPTSTLGLVTFANMNRALKPKGVSALATVYDSCEWQVPISIGAEVIETCFYYMNDWPVETFDWLELPIGTDGEVGFNWGQTEHIKRGITQAELEAVLGKLREEKTW